MRAGRVPTSVVVDDRPHRKARRLQGKSDPVDAEAAARAARTGRRGTLTRRGRTQRDLRLARPGDIAHRADHRKAPGTPRHVCAGPGNDDAGLLPATGEGLP